MTSVEALLSITLVSAGVGYVLGEAVLPKLDKASENSNNAIIAVVVGVLGTIGTFLATKNMEASVAVGGALVGVASNRGVKWLLSVH